MPKPASRNGHTRVSVGRIRAGCRTREAAGWRCRRSTTKASPPASRIGTTISGAIMPIADNAPPATAPATIATPCTAPTPAMPFTRVASSCVTSAM